MKIGLTKWRVAGLAVIVAVAVCAFQATGQDLTQFWKEYLDNARFHKDLYVGETVEVAGAADFESTVNIDGVLTAGGGTAMANGEIISNTPDAVVNVIANDDAVEQLDFRFKSSNQGTAANDYLQLSWWMYDDSAAPVEQEYAQWTVTATDPTSNSEDSIAALALATAGTLAKVVNWSGAAYYPQTDNAVDLGITSTNDFKDAHFQGTVNAGTLSGTALAHNSYTLVKGTSTVASGANSATPTIAGTDADDIAIATLNEVNGTSCSIISFAPGTGNAVLTLSTVTDTTTTFSYMVWQN